MEALRLEDVTVVLGGEAVLEDISFSMDRGEFMGILGPNGAGKTVLLKTILGVIRPSRGRVVVLGREPQAARDRIGYVPQRETMSLDLPVSGLEVLELAASVKGIRDRGEIERVLEAVGLRAEELEKKRYGWLSGGTQQRILLARALLGDPELLLLDEPLSAVDAPTRRDILDFLGEMKGRKTIIMVTHDPNDLVGLADSIMLLNRRIFSLGTPAEVCRPEILSSFYGSKVVVAEVGGCTYVISGDRHA